MNDLPLHARELDELLMDYPADSGVMWLSQFDGFVAGVREQLHHQRETALQLLGGIPGLTCIVPNGAFYLFPDISSLLGKSHAGQRTIVFR